MGKHAYRPESLANPEILALAARVRYHVDPEFPGPGHFKGVVRVTLKDGRWVTEVEEFTRGSVAESDDRRRAARQVRRERERIPLGAERDRLADTIAQLEQLPDASVLVGLGVSAPA